MAISSTDIQFRLSGGASNSDPNASLGGVESSTEITDATVNNLYDDVSGDESSAGDTEYRCFYVHNAHATLTLQSAKLWIYSNTPDSDTNVQVGLGTAGVNATEQTVADESTAPTGVTFSDAANEAGALAIGDIPAGEFMAIWVKRVVNALAAAYDADQATFRVKGQTAA